MRKDGIAALNLFKIDRIHSFDVRCWMFDVHQFLFRSDWTLVASGRAHMKLDSGIVARIRVKIDENSHDTQEKVRNTIFIFV